MDRRPAACRNARHPDRWSFPASAARVRAAHGLTRRAGLSAARRRGVVIRRSGSNVARGLAAGVTAKFKPRRLKLELEPGNVDGTENSERDAQSSQFARGLQTS